MDGENRENPIKNGMILGFLPLFLENIHILVGIYFHPSGFIAVRLWSMNGYHDLDVFVHQN